MVLNVNASAVPITIAPATRLVVWQPGCRHDQYAADGDLFEWNDGAGNRGKRLDYRI